jgi:RNA polymerase sigma factor (sigma-70 family)
MRQVSIDAAPENDNSLAVFLSDDTALRQFSQIDIKMALNVALRRLPPLQRQVILSILKDEAVSACAERLGCTPNSIYKLRERARKSLRQVMDFD